MGKVVVLPVFTRLDLDADRVLDSLHGMLESFVLCGYTKAKDGEESVEFFSSTKSDAKDAVWLLERCKLSMLRLADPLEDD